MDNKEIRTSLGIISDILGILNKEIVDIDKRVTMLEVTNKCEDNENNYITIKIPINASNLDVFRIVFGGMVTESNGLYTHLNIDGDTVFHTEWAKTRYRGGINNETNK